jgi:hypothetical protein
VNTPPRTIFHLSRKISSSCPMMIFCHNYTPEFNPDVKYRMAISMIGSGFLGYVCDLET